MKNLYLIIGPSGSGKSTLAHNLSIYFDMKEVASYTTRPPRYDREPGHIFVSEENFRALGEMVAYTEFDGYRYGVTKNLLDKCDLYVIDPAGAFTLSENYDRPISVIWIAADPDICRQRMKLDGRSKEAIESRIAHDAEIFTDVACMSLLLTYGFTKMCTISADASKDDMLMAAVAFIQKQEETKEPVGVLQ